MHGDLPHEGAIPLSELGFRDSSTFLESEGGEVSSTSLLQPSEAALRKRTWSDAVAEAFGNRRFSPESPPQTTPQRSRVRYWDPE